MMEEKNIQILTNLFGKLEITDNTQLDTLLCSMDNNLATVFLIQAVEFAYERGAFNLVESEVVSKSIRILNSNPNK
jgi:hypothetical protein